MDEYYRAIQLLPAWLAQPLAALPVSVAENVQEIRLRTGRSPVLTVCGRQCPVASLPECPPQMRTLRLTAGQIRESFYALCGGAVHPHQAELSEGYFTTASGCRVGVAGSFLERPGKETVLQEITSLNLRIARSKTIALPQSLRQVLRGHFTSLAVIGEPGSGKTTVLRRIAMELAAQGRAVTVIDERRELFPPGSDAPRPAVDCLSGLSRKAAIQVALRTLSPQVILLDELGGTEEVLALEQGFFSGVDFVASLHASGLEDAFRRPQMKLLRRKEMLHAVVLLGGRETPGQIWEVHRL